MAGNVTILSIEPDALRGIRVTDGGKVLSSAVWPLERAGAQQPAEAPQEDGGGETVTDAGGDTEPAASAGLTLAEAMLAARKKFKTREIVLAMPLSGILVKTFSMPPEAREDLESAVSAEMETISPFPDETLATGCEALSETENGILVLAAAVPEAVSAEITAALSESGLLVRRTDIAACGLARAMWSSIIPPSAGERKLSLFKTGREWDLVLCGRSGPVFMRGLGEVASPGDMTRAVMLSLAEAELACGPAELSETAVFAFPGEEQSAAAFDSELSAFAPVVHATVENPLSALAGTAERIRDARGFDITPASWSSARRDARFKRKIAFFSAAGIAVWVAAVAAMVAGPAIYDSRMAEERKICASHKSQYDKVVSMRKKVRMLQRYAERDKSALASLLAVVKAMPGESEGLVLTRFDYQRDSYREDSGKKEASRSDASRPRVHITGTADTTAAVYAFKDALAAIPAASSGENGEEPGFLFPDVEIKGDVREAKGRQTFTIDAFFDKREDDAPRKKPSKPKDGKNGGGA